MVALKNQGFVHKSRATSFKLRGKMNWFWNIPDLGHCFSRFFLVTLDGSTSLTSGTMGPFVIQFVFFFTQSERQIGKPHVTFQGPIQNGPNLVWVGRSLHGEDNFNFENSTQKFSASATQIWKRFVAWGIRASGPVPPPGATPGLDRFSPRRLANSHANPKRTDPKPLSNARDSRI